MAYWTPFVGRKRELTALRARLDAAAQGQGSLVLVGGDSGIGITGLPPRRVASLFSQFSRGNLARDSGIGSRLAPPPETVTLSADVLRDAFNTIA